MLVIYQDTRELLSVRISRFKECMGLFFCGITLLILSIPLASLDKSSEFSIRDWGLLFFLYIFYGSPFTIAGVLLIFKQRKFNFIIPEMRVICWEGLRLEREISFKEIDHVEVTYSKTGRGLVCIITTSGARILVTRGVRSGLVPLGTRIAKVTGVPLNSQEYSS